MSKHYDFKPYTLKQFFSKYTHKKIKLCMKVDGVLTILSYKDSADVWENWEHYLVKRYDIIEDKVYMVEVYHE